MARGYLLLTTLALTAGACPTSPRPEPFVTGDDLVLVGDTLFDGTGAAPLADAAVVIRGDRIVFAGPRALVTISTGAMVMDLGGTTVLPGFIDAHVHDAYAATNLEAWARAGMTRRYAMQTDKGKDAATIGSILAPYFPTHSEAPARVAQPA